MSEANLYNYVMQCLDTLDYTRREVADGSGVPFSTVSKIAQRSVKAPSVHNVQAIADFFRREQDCADRVCTQCECQKEAA